MFRPNAICTIYPLTGRTLYAESTTGAGVQEGCNIVRAQSNVKPTNSRAMLSGSGEHAEDTGVVARILVDRRTSAAIGAKLVAGGITIRITSIEPKYDTFGRLDHHVIEGTPWV
ncbi:hypothetical protein [Burkholderia vietnamiensis]|uniref:hypothetical protein n=1 Tax=Burkholderia vietnamiensis TaxID=60552 RepID=UPI001CAEFA74|nr:hypothetical protein [Burkholderia vietnamiensis]CAG9228854.1 hypothetical protein BVI1335_70109 [Burkholderia vietnamiensis]HDR9086361.1 hypothetical protein [Burkholderia vietnamiensis]